MGRWDWAARLGGGAGPGGSVFQFTAFLLTLSFIPSQSALYGMGGFPRRALSWSVLGVWGEDPASWLSY